MVVGQNSRNARRERQRENGRGGRRRQGSVRRGRWQGGAAKVDYTEERAEGGNASCAVTPRRAENARDEATGKKRTAGMSAGKC